MSWRKQAACRTEDPELFFPAGRSGGAQSQTRRALAVCARCPVVQMCLADALTAGETSGVWGGTTEDERRAIRARSARRRSATRPGGRGSG